MFAQGAKFMSKQRSMREIAIAFTLCILLVSAFSALAQSDAARLQGVVTDPSGAIVPEAGVTLSDQARSKRIHRVNNRGFFISRSASGELPTGNKQSWFQDD